MSEETSAQSHPARPMKNLVPHDRITVDIALLIARWVAASVFFMAGGMKTWGWWEGPGLEGMYAFLGVAGYFVAIGEFFGSLGLIVGFLSRFSAASLIVIMIGAIAMGHWEEGFMGKPGSFWAHVTMIGLLAVTLIAGPGRFAVMRYAPMPPKLRLLAE